MTLKESLRSACQSFLLGKGHAFRSTAMRTVSTVLDLNKNQHLLVHHDQVNFTKAAVIVALQRFESPPVEKRFGALFPLATL